jgi:2-iminobutanoate/2-iminopropanoate deaminase
MARRKSIYIEAFGHTMPIPAAARVGNTVMSGIIYGLDPETGKAATTLERQCELMFQHLRAIVEASGARLDDIVKLNVQMVDRSQRKPLNDEWLKMFPDPENRPARQAMQCALGDGILVQCDFVAVVA